MLRAVERWAKAEKLTEPDSDTAIGNEASEGFHGACGFREGERCIAFVKAVG